MSLPKLELVSFKLCPFVQRAVVTLKKKHVDFDITYIDLANPPAWFKEISPLGQVPILKVGEGVLFESTVIQEYVDEITPPSLHPTDPFLKAQNRSWMAFCGELLPFVYKSTSAQTEETYLTLESDFKPKLQRLEDAHSGQAFFNGENFNLVDATYASLFMRLDLIEKHCGKKLLEETPKLKQWSKNLLACDFVQESVVDEFPKIFCAMIQKNQGYLATQL